MLNIFYIFSDKKSTAIRGGSNPPLIAKKLSFLTHSLKEEIYFMLTFLRFPEKHFIELNKQIKLLLLHKRLQIKCQNCDVEINIA